METTLERTARAGMTSPSLPAETSMGASAEVATKDFSVWYDIETATIFCKGALRLQNAQDYTPISNLFEAVMEQQPPLLQLNLMQLDFLNSSGINMLVKLVIRVRQQDNLQMAVVGSKRIPWQIKSLKNLQRLMPNLQLEFVGL